VIYLAENSFVEDLFRLQTYYQLLRKFLFVHFVGDILHTASGINDMYLELCIRVEEILKKPELSELAKLPWRPFENILVVDPDYPEGDWEYGGRQLTDNFISKIEELFIKNGKQKFRFLQNESNYVESIEKFIADYKNYKKTYDEKEMEKIKQSIAKRLNANQLIQFELPQISKNSPYQAVLSDLKESNGALNIKNGKQAVVSAGLAMHMMLQIFHKNELDFYNCIILLEKFPEKKKYVTDLHYIREKRNDYGHPNFNKPDLAEAQRVIETSIKIFKDFV